MFKDIDPKFEFFDTHIEARSTKLAAVQLNDDELLCTTPTETSKYF